MGGAGGDRRSKGTTRNYSVQKGPEAEKVAWADRWIGLLTDVSKLGSHLVVWVLRKNRVPCSVRLAAESCQKSCFGVFILSNNRAQTQERSQISADEVPSV